MEIDALYGDVIAQRWEQFTGKKSELIGPDVAHASPATAGMEGHRARSARQPLEEFHSLLNTP